MVALGTFAVVVMRARPQDTANRALAALAALVALNYAMVPVSDALHPSGAGVFRSGASHWLLLGAFALEILEPIPLVLLALVYPTRRKAAGPILVAVGLAAAGMEALLFAQPSLTVVPNHPARLLVETYVTAAYVMAWLAFASAGLRDGPLASRLMPRGFLVGWSVVTFLRIGPAFSRALGFGPAAAGALDGSPAGAALASAAMDLVIILASLVAAGVALLVVLRWRHAGIPRLLASSALACGLLWTGLHFVLILHLVFLQGALPAPGTMLGEIHVMLVRGRYPARWIFFAAAVAPSFLRSQTLGMEAPMRRALLVGAASGWLLVLFVVALAAAESLVEVRGGALAEALVIGGIVGLAATQSVRLARRLADRAFPPDRARDEAYRRLRRIEILLDAEAAARDGRLAEGALDSLRRSIGVSADEARVAAAIAGAQPSPRVEPGQVLARRYRIVGRLGQGGSATVFAAHDDTTGHRVAMKRLASDRGRVAWADLDRELAAARRVQHPNVAPILDSFVEGDAAFIVTPLMAGGSLADRIARGALTPAETVRVGVAVLDALAAAHDRGVIHRDVKPANVLLDADGKIVLSDFGIARVDADRRTATSALDPRVPGTLAYLPPEALDGGAPTFAWDLYAAGTLLHECLLGRLPRGSDAPPGDALGDVIRLARAEDPAARFPSAARMRDALQAAGI